MAELTLPDHGGDLAWAQRNFGGSAADWLDLSTGISPWPWPVPPIPCAIWQRLPEADGMHLRSVAATLYGCASDHLLPVPGSQFAIACLPRIAPTGVVAVPNPGYTEHRRAWSAAGHRVVEYGHLDELAALIDAGDVLHAVVINPNNPSAEQADPARLLQWRAQLSDRGGLLIVDEAFIDYQSQLSLAAQSHLPNLVILRSLGKFFGLAGVRLGFALAGPAILAQLMDWCSPWQINHPAQWIGAQALADGDWQVRQRLRIAQHAGQMQRLLQNIFPRARIGQAGLFLTLTDPATSLYQQFLRFAEAQVLLRYGRSGDGEWLRFGLPGDDLPRLAQRLEQVLGKTS